MQEPQRRDATFQDKETAETLLRRSVDLALKAVGFEAAEPTALEGFRLLAEECMKMISTAEMALR